MRIVKATVSVIALAATCAAHAQSYPARNVLFLSSVSTGAAEATIRATFDRVKQNTGATLVFEPRTGGAGAPALQALKAVAPDGHTLGITYASALTLNPVVNPELGIDPLKDFVPITNLMAIDIGIAVRPDFPARDLRALIELAKAKPGALRFGYVGTGNRSWLLTLEERSGTKFLGVPFKQTNEVQTAGLGGHIDVWFHNVGGMAAMAGQVRPLVQGGGGASKLLAGEVPLLRDLYKFDMISWFGVIGPAGTPPAVVGWMNRELVRAFRTPEVMKIVENGNLAAIADSSEEFAKTVKSEVEQMRELSKKYPDLR